MGRRHLLFLAAPCVALFAGAPLHAQKIEGYRHTGWTAEDGAPTPVRSLALATNGFLWLAGGDGLFRFDGRSFERMPSLQDPELGDFVAQVVHASPSGDIWIGYNPGAVALYRHGVLHDMHMPHAPEFVVRIEDDGRGGIWVVSSRDGGALSHYRAGRWEEMGEAQGVPQEQVTQVFVDRDGATWVVEQTKLLFLRRGARRFEVTPAIITHGAAIGQGRDGRLWLSDRRGVRPLPDYPHGAKGEAEPETKVSTGSAHRVLLDREGNLWSTDRENGLVRIAATRLGTASGRARPERLKLEDGLTSDHADQVLQDREGNIWIGTSDGLDRLRLATVRRQEGIPPSSVYAAESDANGTLYVLSDAGIHAIQSGMMPRLISIVSTQVSSPCRLRDGFVVAMAPGAILRLRPDGVSTAKGFADAPYGCVEDARSRVWIDAPRAGLLWGDTTGWHQLPHPSDIAVSTGIVMMPHGTAVVKLASEVVMVLDPAHPRFVSGARFGVGAIAGINPGRRDLLISGSRGLARLRDGAVRTIDGARYPWLNRLRGLFQSRRGDTWMLAQPGMIRVRTRDLDLAFDRPGSPLPHDLFDAADGFLGRRQKVGLSGPQIFESADGVIRFLSSAGVMVIDPNAIRHNLLPPPIVVGALIAGGRKILDPSDVALPSGTSSFTIAYAALSLSVPRRVQVRYKLEGVDNDWIDPGDRREADYSNIGPGEYRFRVIAANNDGVWNRMGASLRITIAPTFLQSIWFKLLCALGAGVLLWWAYSIRVRRVTGRLQAAMEIRLHERERIARELHDTLLQSFHGLMLHFQAAANRLPEGGLARRSIDDALLRADGVVAEGRDRVRELRVENAQVDLAEGWVALAAEFGADDPARFELTVEGKPRRLHPLAHEELQQIGNEAIRNAFQHAGASSIEVTLTYHRGQVRLDVRDDGVGLPDEIAARGERLGHFGLLGMRERARRLRASLTIVSREGGGTEVLLSVPGKAAFVVSEEQWWFPKIFRAGRARTGS